MQVKHCRYCRYSLQARTTATARLSPRTATATTACAAPASAGRGTTTTPAPRPPSSTSTEGQQQRRVWLVTSLLSYCHLDINVQLQWLKDQTSARIRYCLCILHICSQQSNPRWAVSRSLLTPPPPRPGGCWCWCWLHWFTPIVGEPEPPGLQNTAGAGSRNGSLLWTLYLMFMPYFATL